MDSLPESPLIVKHALDVNSVSAITRLRAFIDDDCDGKLDMLINNAGISYSAPAIEMDVDTARLVFETNLFSVMEMNKAFAPCIIKTRGVIIATGSVAGIISNPFVKMYHVWAIKMC